MRPWFKKSCDWHRSAPVDQLRSLLAQQAPLALVVLDSICAWCAENNVVVCPAPSVDREVRAWTTNAALGRRLVGALVDVGLLTQQGEGYLIETALVRPEPQQQGEEAPPSSRRQRQRPETGKAARMRRYRAGKKASTGGSAEASTVDAYPSTEASTEASTRRLREASTQETGGVYGASTEASTVDTPAPALSPPDPPPAPAPTPAQAQAQAHAGGAPAAAPAPVVSGKTKPKKPTKDRALPAPKALAEAYAAGISQATGAPCSPPADPWERKALETCLATHAPGLVGAEALGWLTRAAQDFASAKAEDRWTVDKGFPPKMALAWLDGANRPAPRDHGPPPPPPGPMRRPGPGPSRNWLADPDPPPLASAPAGELADLTHDLFAPPPDLLDPEAAQ